MAAGNEMRVGDAEREAAAAELREHFASGRLDQEELDERLSAVFAARTRGDLDSLFADLPSQGRGWTGAGASAGQGTGPQGPFGPGGPFGPQGPYGPGTRGVRYGWQPGDNAWWAPAGRSIGRVVFTAVMLGALLFIGIFGAFGIGAGRPFGIVLIIAAFALLRRLLFMILGRRRVRGRCARRGHGRRRR